MCQIRCYLCFSLPFMLVTTDTALILPPLLVGLAVSLLYYRLLQKVWMVGGGGDKSNNEHFQYTIICF